MDSQATQEEPGGDSVASWHAPVLKSTNQQASASAHCAPPTDPHKRKCLVGLYIGFYIFLYILYKFYTGFNMFYIGFYMFYVCFIHVFICFFMSLYMGYICFYMFSIFLFFVFFILFV